MVSSFHFADIKLLRGKLSDPFLVAVGSFRTHSRTESAQSTASRVISLYLTRNIVPTSIFIGDVCDASKHSSVTALGPKQPVSDFSGFRGSAERAREVISRNHSSPRSLAEPYKAGCGIGCGSAKDAGKVGTNRRPLLIDSLRSDKLPQALR